ncbi:MAG: nicotinamide mononucleotide transporter [Paraglaciecola sp.]|nr:nicotinamide mononucleotide transporter [Paraglaciecola sp.]
MNDVVNQVLKQFSEQSGLEVIAVVLALAYVWLAAKQHLMCWPCALVSTGIYTYIFWEVSLPFHTMLNAYYIVMAVYGWWQWNKPETQQANVITWPYTKHLIAILVLFIASMALAYLAKSILDAEHLYLDAFITVFSVFTTILVAHKVHENWLYWMLINSFGVYLFFSKELYLTAALSFLYLGFSVYGYISWGKNTGPSSLQPAE